MKIVKLNKTTRTCAKIGVRTSIRTGLKIDLRTSIGHDETIYNWMKKKFANRIKLQI